MQTRRGKERTAIVRSAGRSVAARLADPNRRSFAPLSPMVGDVHESNPGASRKIESRDPRSLDVKAQIHEGRTVRFFVGPNAQGGNAALDDSLVTEVVKLSFACDAGELPLEAGEIEWTAHIFAELMLDSPIGVGIGAGNLDGIHFLDRRVLARGTLLEITLPYRRILNRVRQERFGLAGGASVAKLDQL